MSNEFNTDPHGLRDGSEENHYTFDDLSPFPAIKYPPEVINELHQFSDADVSSFSRHHTLGPGHSQASPGDHTHDGGMSKPLFRTFKGTGTTTSSGLLVIATGATFPIGSAYVMYDQTGRSAGPFCSAIFYDVAVGSIGTQWINGTAVINAGSIAYRGVVFP